MIPPRQGRDGFESQIALYRNLTITASTILTTSLFFFDSPPKAITLPSILVISIGAFGWYLVESLTKPPSNDPHHYVSWVLGEEGGKKDDKKVLVMMGDSITHQTLSGEFVKMIRNLRPDLHIVNNGQNSILTYTVLKERLDWTIACNPTFVSLLIGTNDVKGIYNTEWGAGSKDTWKFPEDENVDYDSYEKNLKNIVKGLVDSSDAFIAVHTLPPMGEDLECDANVHVRKGNDIIKKICKGFDRKRVTVINTYTNLEKFILKNTTEEQRKSSLSVDLFGSVSINMAIGTIFLGKSLDDIGKAYGLVSMCDGLHLNDKGAEVVSDSVCAWLKEFESDADYVKVKHEDSAVER